MGWAKLLNSLLGYNWRWQVLVANQHDTVAHHKRVLATQAESEGEQLEGAALGEPGISKHGFF